LQTIIIQRHHATNILIFWSVAILLRLCVHRAYLDFNRTLHGFANHESADHLRESAYLCVFKLLTTLRKRNIGSQHQFDKWHEMACAQLQQLHRDGGFERFSVGQAQKMAEHVDEVFVRAW
jgi:hypothetical protein